MRMIEADKVIPLVRLLLLFHPNAERIVEDMQAVVDSHTIEAEPVRHGRWIKTENGMRENLNTRTVIPVCFHDCSICGWHTGNQGQHFNYCPNCGAKMDLVEERHEPDEH